MDPALGHFKHGLNHRLDLFDGNRCGYRTRCPSEARILGDSDVRGDRLSQVVEARVFHAAAQTSFAAIEKRIVLSPRNARLLWLGPWKTGLFSALRRALHCEGEGLGSRLLHYKRPFVEVHCYRVGPFADRIQILHHLLGSQRRSWRMSQFEQLSETQITRL